MKNQAVSDKSGKCNRHGEIRNCLDKRADLPGGLQTMLCAN
ncbi:MAG: hypothetical protein PHV24_06625 [Candidatus Kapabacteria bacterium]|nr:hypothetical protein [Candidatus Kapabacteria bacterium]